MRGEGKATDWRVAAAFAAVYLIWGSTYLAIRFAIETLPPFLMTGVRFLVAGALLYGWLRVRGTPRPPARQWRSATVVGALLLLLGNGSVVVAEQWIPSGLAALLVGTLPLWMVLMDWGSGGGRPARRVFLGLLLGFGGVALLVDPGSIGAAVRPHLQGAAAVLFASISWAAGSIYARRADLPSSSLLATGMEMLTGGGLAILVGLLLGEARAFDPGTVSTTSLAALLYLILFGSIVAFTAYIWLLSATTPSRVSTYAYVNPVIAVFLGWLLADEPLGGRVLLATLLIVAAVLLITHRRRQHL